MFHTHRSLALLTAVATLGMIAHAQTPAKDLHRDGMSLALTYDTLGGYMINANSFATQGGAVELNSSFLKGFGAAASVLGLHADSIGSGVPVNMVIVTFGPSYTYRYRHANLFAHGLVGEVDAFQGLYPQRGVASSSANSLAAQAGGGVDVGLSRHLAVRLVQVEYVRTQLPNSLTNVQNNLRLGVGIVLR